MTRVLLLRHAETAAPGFFHGAESDIGLGPRGFEQADRVAAEIAAPRPDALYSSAMKRARETAAAIGRACHLEVTIVPPLHERIMGPLSGTTWDASRTTWDATKALWIAGDLDATHEGGESFAQIRDRVVPAFRNILMSEKGRTVVVVAHGVVIKVLMTSLIAGLSPADFDAIGIENVAIHDLRWDDPAGMGEVAPREP